MKGNMRLYHILESVQYGILYMVAAFIGGVGLDFSFAPYTEDISTREIFKEIFYQCVLLIVVVYCTRGLVKQVPLLFPTSRGFIPYTTPEFNGEMMMGLIFLGSQLNLIQKIDLLAKRLYTYYYKEERVVKDKQNNLKNKIVTKG
jgi:hypothetical protein